MKILIIFTILLFSILSTAHPLKIAIIDTGINTNSKVPKNKICGTKDFSGGGIKDVIGHGTDVANIIAEELGNTDYCFYILKYYHNAFIPKDHLISTKEALKEAIKLQVNVINYSSSSSYSDDEEALLLFKALRQGIKIFVPSGNGLNLNLDKNCNQYPACYFNNLYVVGRSDEGINKISGYGSLVRRYENGGTDGKYHLGGTSQATAITCGKEMKNK